jgi:hypothetical protein
MDGASTDDFAENPRCLGATHIKDSTGSGIQHWQNFFAND